MRALAVLMFAVMALVTLAHSASAQVPDPFAAQLARKLAAYERQFVAAGFTRVGGPFVGLLRAGESRVLEVTLRAGGNFRIVGVCDVNCGDLDMRLFDQSNALITEDLSTTDDPVISSMPRWTGLFHVQVMMFTCDAPAGCYFALNVYGQ